MTATGAGGPGDTYPGQIPQLLGLLLRLAQGRQVRVAMEPSGTYGDALRQAVKNDHCTIVEVMVTQELGDPFRRDALKKPKRLLDKYAALSVA